MSKTFADMSMSLDGFIAGPHNEIDPLHDWIFKHQSTAGARLLQESMGSIGAVVMGRNTFNLIDSPDGWGAPDGTHFALPVYVLTHHGLPDVTKGVTSFIFVTGGIQSAVRQAHTRAGDKRVSIMGAQSIQEGLENGLIDELDIHIIPVLLGQGIRLFDHLESKQITLEQTQLVDASGVTHIKYNVIRSGEK